jgi:AAA domain-containing protein
VTRRPSVVELVGAPGSGKSSVAEAIGALSGVVVVKDHQRRDLPVLAWSAATAGRVLFASPPPGVSRLRWIAWVGRCRAASRVVRQRLAAGARVIVLDQGPAYTLGRMAESADRDAAVARWHRARTVEVGRLLDAVVVLDGDTDLLAARMRSRAKRHQADELEAASAASYLDGERAIAGRIATDLAAEGVMVVYLDAARSLAENVAVVEAVLQ